MDALALIHDLTTRGLCLTPTPRGTIQVSPSGSLSPTDRDLIRQHKAELLAELQKCDGVNIVNFIPACDPGARTTQTPVEPSTRDLVNIVNMGLAVDPPARTLGTVASGQFVTG